MAEKTGKGGKIEFRDMRKGDLKDFRVSSKRMINAFKYEEDFHIPWRRIRNPLRVAFNFIVVMLARHLPDMEFKSWVYRRIGMKIGRNVHIFGTTFDIFFPELIEIGDNCILGEFTVFTTHAFLKDHWRKGRIKIGSNVLIGAVSFILPGVEIGDNATVASYSLVNKDVEPGAFVGGVPIKEIGASSK